MDKWHVSRLKRYFAVYMFAIILSTTLIIAFLTFILISSRIFSAIGARSYVELFILLIINVLIGTGISFVVSRRIFGPITELSKASQIVAKGDFSVRLEETHRVKELRDMAVNFNVMVSELGSIETFRNDFVANVSHEFKTPIAAIEGYTTLLQDPGLSEAERQEYSSVIIESTKQLSILCENILKISRLENQQIVTEQRKFRVDEQIRQAILLLETKWSGKELNLVIDLDPVLYYGSEEMLMYVWSNLLGNAIKFTPRSGIVTVNLRQLEQMISVTVTDTGAGMTEEVQAHIFEKFYQGDRARYSEGNGLGLTLVKRIVDLCGGEIKVDSKPMCGSTFTVLLPIPR